MFGATNNRNVAFRQTGVEMELVESTALLEWFANNYKNFGATLEIITDKSQEGAQFVKGFGGIGGKNRRGSRDWAAILATVSSGKKIAAKSCRAQETERCWISCPAGEVRCGVADSILAHARLLAATLPWRPRVFNAQ